MHMLDLETMDFCPIELTLELISKKWNIQIIRDIFFGKTHFNEFKEGKPELTNKVLSRCLKQMEDNGLIAKSVNPNNPKNTEYKLTKKGHLLNNILFELAMYPLNVDENDELFDAETKGEIETAFKEKLNLN